MIVNSVGFQMLIKREMVRTFAIINQVIWPPVIQTLLYVFVFGLALGTSIKTMHGVPYAQFLIPGLIMLQVIDQTYSESSSSVFQGRFMNSIQELLIAPLSAIEIVLGYVVAGAVRAIFIALLVTVLGVVFVHACPSNWGLVYARHRARRGAVLVAGDHLRPARREVRPHRGAHDFLHHAARVRRRRLHVGASLPPLLRQISLFNPMAYMIDAFRYSYINK